MKFIHLSPPTPDFSSELQSQLRILNGNILYITREIDQIKKLLTDNKLQKQVSDYFEDTEQTPEEITGANHGSSPE